MSAEASTTSPTIQKKDDSVSSSSPAAQQQQQPLLSNKQFLKQLEKSWKPFPPWCVSSKRVPEDLNEELSLFSNLIAPTSVEMKQLAQLQETIQKAIISSTSSTAAASSTTVSTSGCTAAGFGLIEGPLFFSVDTTTHDNSSETSAKIVSALLETKLFDESVAPVVKDESKRMKSGYSIRLREAQSNSQTARNVILYFGEAATRSKKMGALLKSGFESTNAQACIAAWHVLMSSLKQTRNLDDTEPTALSSDAAATMMLSVANSYDAAPTCSQALTDFFLLYGFATSFDMSSKSVTIKGALVDVPKVHSTEAMSVIDPLLAEYDGYRGASGGGTTAHGDFDVETLSAEKDSESVTNLAAGMTTASVNRLVNIFAYCYRVIAEYSRGRAEQERGRAESTLSTFLGGGPFWTRVVVLSEQGCDPYPEIVQHGLTAANSNNNSSASAGGNKAVRNNNNNSNNNNNNNNGKNNNYYNNNNNYNNGRGGRGYNRGGRGGGGRGNNNNNGYHHQNSTFVPHHHHHHHHQFVMPTPHHQNMMNTNSTFQPHHHHHQHHHQQQFLSQQDMILLPTPNSRTTPPTAALPSNANNNSNNAAASGFQQPQQNRQW